jgi:hypothetical protein
VIQIAENAMSIIVLHRMKRLIRAKRLIRRLKSLENLKKWINVCSAIKVIIIITIGELMKPKKTLT